ncbi:hypothetical protein F2P56_008286 [Juglans regia]|uniref:Protein NODULATION SIGNALING PATHWAY 2-like n=2 Tax=Juglans regia TaxID=51240 RepID=A0A2I4F3G6_JUGRE|nr:protein NODULATION SIGNALING PATHWAY 2-like [Juglans regia]KAF5471498.1 hypothetical protein F2P56_008286 [Juglans regia]
MMQPDLFQHSWPFYNVMDSTFDQGVHHDLSMDGHLDGYEFSSILFTTTEDSSEFSSTPFSSTLFPSNFVQYPFCDDSQQVMLAMKDILMVYGDLESILNDDAEIECTNGLLGEREGSFSLQQFSPAEDFLCSSPSAKSESSLDVSSIQPLLTFPREDMEVKNLMSLHHLLKAYGEALEKDQRELAHVILRCIGEKVSPVGKNLERVAFYLSQEIDNQGDYLKQESYKNFEVAFQAFYQSFPQGRFAHFAANSAILEAMPDDTETIHIVDFDMGEGIQWPPMIEEIARQQKTLRLTSIKWEDEDCDRVPSPWRFEETKRRLCNQARGLGLKLKVQEMRIEHLVSETKKMKKMSGRREWLVFNCMVGLPHMARSRSRRLVMEFLRVAKESIVGLANCSTSNSGIITFGDGVACEKLKHCSSFGSFFYGCLEHYQAMLESLEVNFSLHLPEARIAMECLFVAPYISSLSWLQMWKEIREGSHLNEGFGLPGRRLSKEILAEVKELVKGEISYRASIQGRVGNEMILEWKGTTMVKVSIWTN